MGAFDKSVLAARRPRAPRGTTLPIRSCRLRRSPADRFVPSSPAWSACRDSCCCIWTRVSRTGGYCSLLKTERLSPYPFPSPCKSHYRTRPAYRRRSIHQWRRARLAVRPARCPPPQIAHGGPADRSPVLRISKKRRGDPENRKLKMRRAGDVEWQDARQVKAEKVRDFSSIVLCGTSQKRLQSE